MKRLFSTAVVFAAVATTVTAQEPKVTPEIRPFVGVYIPTGGQRDLFKDAAMFGLQAAFEMQPNFHLLGTFGWVPAQTKYAVAKDNAQIYQYDVGAELGIVRPLGASWELKPFVGVGGGARTYVYQAEQLANKTCAVGYGALGTELQLGRAALRLEGRDNVFCFRSAVPGVSSKTRNDVGVSLGLAYHFR